MSQEKYFRDELDFLKVQSVAFTESHPQLSRFLQGKNTDPDVERLLEGFAFLTARLREKVEDEFPELTHSIINMLWPNYLRPVPSFSIVQFTPIDKAISTRQTIPENTDIDSKAVFDTVCRFKTCRKLDVYPLRLVDIVTAHSRESSIIELNLEVLGKQSLFDIGLKNLPFFLGGQRYSAQMLYLWLNHYLSHIELVYEDKIITIPASNFKSRGFNNEDAVMPYPKNVYEGYRILQEYLTFPDAFLFGDVDNLDRFVTSEIGQKFNLKFVFFKNFPADVRIREESFRLFCAPVINLFSHDADPIDLTGKRTEYRVTPSSRFPEYFEIFSIDHVEGRQEEHNLRVKGQKRIYASFESFQHEIERSRNRLALYYRVRVKDSVSKNGFDHYISFVRGDETQGIGFSEAISLQLMCTNRQLPLELGLGDICVPTNNSPSFVTFSNITEPTHPLRPTLDGSLLWTLISNLSLNYLSLLSKDALCSVLRAYDFRALVDKQAERIARQRLDGIIKITSRPIERIIKGLPVRGLLSELELNQEAFSSEGDLYLFGSVLSRFFSLYANINSFHELIVINSVNQERYSWGAQAGLQPLI
ncbi:type VI secretion system baseplate subunit TssF [Photobacterium leiognathi]|uniref:type VI secretion system baseplate subunit TssF n=1 Tax=Photobacterium leiognathi TaxID=553611 RepID=UPI00298199F4|nr:type VI secretion system baseplate subunit TssF [Photobacterium leiognathi]